MNGWTPERGSAYWSSRVEDDKARRLVLEMTFAAAAMTLAESREEAEALMADSMKPFHEAIERIGLLIRNLDARP